MNQALNSRNSMRRSGPRPGPGPLPGLFASDVVYATNFATKGLWTGINSRLKALPFGRKLAHAAIAAGTVNGKEYVVPNTIDTSVLFYNKNRKAGLDPN